MIDVRRALAALLLAFLLGMTLVSWFMATANFRIVDRERNRRIDEVFASIPDSETRTMAVRYVASESNRALFTLTGPVGAVLAVAAGVLVLRARNTGRGSGLCVALVSGLLLTSLFTAVSVPWFVTRGRAIDFVSRTPTAPPEVGRFLLLHVAYVLCDAAKAGCALGLVGFVLTARHRKEEP